MQTFTYARTAPALKSSITMYLLMMTGDVVLIAVVALLLRSPWNWVLVGAGGGLTGLAVWALTRPLRTCHTWDGALLTLRMGPFRVQLPHEAIAGVEPFPGGLPRGITAPTQPPCYRHETDTLYLVAERRGMVEIRLTRPLAARTHRQGAVEFTRVVLSLDDPDQFVAALTGQALPVAADGLCHSGAAAVAPVAVAPVAAAAGSSIRLEGLSKRFGDFAAVNGISLDVRPGEVLAFLGSNGAGKTTTIRMMVGLLRPTEGRVLISGRDVWAEGAAARRLLGYVPDVPILYEGLTAREFLWLVAGLYDLPHAQGRGRAEELLGILKLERWGDHLMRNFSLGMKRKMAIAAALVHRPQVLLLDEVTNGLDPRATREVKDFIRDAARAGTAVFLTTHLLDVAQELAHRIAVIHQGELRVVGTLAELRGVAGRPDAGLEELFLALTDAPPGAGTGVSA